MDENKGKVHLGVPSQRPPQDDEDGEREFEKTESHEDCSPSEGPGGPSSRDGKNDPDFDERNGASHLGEPDQEPTTYEPVTDDEREIARAQKDKEEQKEWILALDAEIDKGLPRLYIPSILWHPVVVCALILGGGLLGLFVIAQVSWILTTVATMPGLMATVAMWALVIVLAALLFAAGRLVWAYIRLKKSPQIQLEALEKLSERREMRKFSDEKKRKARDELRTYLEGYPREGELNQTFGRWGVGDSELKGLALARRQLMDSRSRKASDEWLEDYRRGFQKKLDAIAGRRISRWAKRVGVKTAVVPYPLVDTLVICYCAYEMLSDLCQIYNVRFGRWNTLAVMIYVIWITLIAGGVSTLEEELEEGFEWAQNNIPGVALRDGINDIPGLGKILSKLTGGGVNAILLWRLGRKCQQLLRPVYVD